MVILCQSYLIDSDLLLIVELDVYIFMDKWKWINPVKIIDTSTCWISILAYYVPKHRQNDKQTIFWKPGLIHVYCLYKFWLFSKAFLTQLFVRKKEDSWLHIRLNLAPNTFKMSDYEADLLAISRKWTIYSLVRRNEEWIRDNPCDGSCWWSYYPVVV